MKKIASIFLLSALLGIAGASAQNVPNAGFETWSSSMGSEIPDGWFTSSAFILFGTNKPVTKSTDSHTGSYAMRLEAKVVSMNGQTDTVPGTAFTGIFNITDQIFGFPYTAHPSKLTFYYKYTPAAGGDSMKVMVTLQKSNPAQGYPDLIGMGEYVSGEAAGTYQKVELPIDYFTSGDPDTATIFVYSSASMDPILGSVMFLDDIHFDTDVITAIPDEAQAENVGENYPNPVRDVTYFPIDMQKPASVSLRVYDLGGREVYQQHENLGAGRQQLKLDASGLRSGAYLYSIASADFSKKGKLIVTR